MRVGVIQSNYIPWRGYFDFIASVDVFVFHDCVQYTKQDWRNRNRLKFPEGVRWLTVPVKAHPVHTAINEVEIAGSEWLRAHEAMIERSLGKCPHFKAARALWSVAKRPHRTISELNQALIRNIADYLGIRTRFVNSRDFSLTGAKTERLLQIMKKLGATTYLSGPAAKAYLDERAMNEAGVKVDWMRYRPSEPVSVLDAIAHRGSEAMQEERLAA